MGIRVTAETLRKQLELSKQLDFLKLPYHAAILQNQTPAVDWRRYRAVAHIDAAASQGSPW
jgi:hypothetical protein